MAEAHARLAEARLAARQADSDQAQLILQNELNAVRADSKLLIDRIVQMSGQPALFHPAPVLPAAPEAAPSKIPGPKTRKSFDDVHEAAREAIRTGKLNLGADT